jgi:hypothetical protein
VKLAVSLWVMGTCWIYSVGVWRHGCENSRSTRLPSYMTESQPIVELAFAVCVMGTSVQWLWGQLRMRLHLLVVY